MEKEPPCCCGGGGGAAAGTSVVVTVEPALPTLLLLPFPMPPPKPLAEVTESPSNAPEEETWKMLLLAPLTLPPCPSSSVEVLPAALLLIAAVAEAAREIAAARPEGPNAASHECGAAAFASAACEEAGAGHSADAEEGSSRHAAEEEDRDAALLLPLMLL